MGHRLFHEVCGYKKPMINQLITIKVWKLHYTLRCTWCFCSGDKTNRDGQATRWCCSLFCSSGEGRRLRSTNQEGAVCPEAHGSRKAQAIATGRHGTPLSPLIQPLGPDRRRTQRLQRATSPLRGFRCPGKRSGEPSTQRCKSGWE